VIHLAATTGKARPEQYFRVNAGGTARLIEQCEQKGVKNFLYVSTIAVKFADKTTYPYAQSKQEGESVLKMSRLNYAIVRPTIVIGKKAAVWEALSRLARKRILLMPGDGRVRIQPIHLEDLIDSLLMILSGKHFSNEIFEVGGPEEITFEQFLKRIHYFYYGKDPRVVHIPLKPVMTILSLVEKYLDISLPVGAGQFSAFLNDGTIQRNKIFDQLAGRMRDIDRMIQEVISSE